MRSASKASEWFKVAVQADGKQRKLDEFFAPQSSCFKKVRTSLGTAVPLMDLTADDNDDDEGDDKEEDDPEVAAATTTTTTTSKRSRKKRSQLTLSVPPVAELATGGADINSGNRRSGRSRTNRMAMMIQRELGDTRVNTEY